MTVREGDDYRLSGRHVLPASRWFFGGHYAEDDVDIPVFVDQLETTAYGVRAGKYLGRTTTLEIAADRTDAWMFSRSWCASLTCSVQPRAGSRAICKRIPYASKRCTCGVRVR